MARARVRALTAEEAGIGMPLWRRPAIGLAAAGLLFAAGATGALAHHGWSSYDSSTLLRMSGRMVEVDYRNPHVQVVIEVPAEPEEDGTIEDEPLYLLAVLAPPARSEGRGMPRAAFQLGEMATVEGYKSRDEEREMRAERITIGSTTVDLR
jgi:Family of unknown function (DUF6152)